LRTAHKYLTDRGVPFATNQVQYSLLSRTAEFNKVIETAEELGTHMNDDDGDDDDDDDDDVIIVGLMYLL
jgi:hypothetical protein